MAVIAVVVRLMLPGSAWGHGAEYLFAKLTLCRDHECFLEVTADYGSNPMLHGEEDARQAVMGLLKVESGGPKEPAEATGPPLIEKRQKLDPTTPGYDGGNPQETHQLLTAIWHWKPPGPSLVLQVSPGTPYDALLWTVDQSRPEEKPHWTMLIAGDTSPVIKLPLEGKMMLENWWLGAAVVTLIAAVFILNKSRV